MGTMQTSPLVLILTNPFHSFFGANFNSFTDLYEPHLALHIWKCNLKFSASFCSYFIIVKLFLYSAEAILLGFQHYLVMLGTTVLIPAALVPQMGGGNVSHYKKYTSNQAKQFFKLLYS